MNVCLDCDSSRTDIPFGNKIFVFSLQKTDKIYFVTLELPDIKCRKLEKQVESLHRENG